jgi:hypothetical protein
MFAHYLCSAWLPKVLLVLETLSYAVVEVTLSLHLIEKPCSPINAKSRTAAPRKRISLYSQYKAEQSPLPDSTARSKHIHNRACNDSKLCDRDKSSRIFGLRND